MCDLSNAEPPQISLRGSCFAHPSVACVLYPVAAFKKTLVSNVHETDRGLSNKQDRVTLHVSLRFTYLTVHEERAQAGLHQSLMSAASCRRH